MSNNVDISACFKKGSQPHRLWEHVRGMKHDSDLPITELYRVCVGVPDVSMSPRSMQQKLGPIIARVNKRIKGHAAIVPGRVKRSYRLEFTSED